MGISPEELSNSDALPLDSRREGISIDGQAEESLHSRYQSASINYDPDAAVSELER